MGWTNGWKFDASKATHRGSFSVFMEFVRSSLGEGRFVMQDARRLPPQAGDDNLVFQDLELSAGGEGTAVVTLRLRTDNLYVVGFRNTAGDWFHVADLRTSIPGTNSRRLPVTGSYQGHTGLGQLDRVNLSVHTIQRAIRGLSGYGGGHQDNLGDWLRTLIVSFVEASRFATIGATVAGIMSHAETVVRLSAHPHLMGQIRNWGSLSTAVIEAANDVVQDPDSNIFPGFRENCGINTAYQAAATLGLVLITSAAARRGAQILMQFPNANAAGYDGVALGMTLLEVVSVVILDIDGEDPGDLYGTVRVSDSFGSINMFLRDRSDFQSVRPGDQAELVWPDRAISAADDLVIDLHLMDRDTDLSPDDVVSRGQVVWISRDATTSNCNMVRSTVVPGNYGSAQVFYAVLTDAVVATVEVLLVDGDGETVPDVYGAITAATEMAPGTKLHYDLFRHAPSDHLPVPAGTNIPLRRKVIAAALGSPLTVDVDLWDKDSFPDPSPDDHIVAGSVAFQPRFQDSEAQDITGPNGKVQVHVTWSVTHS